MSLRVLRGPLLCWTTCLFGMIGTLSASGASPADDASVAGSIDFQRDIRPILSENCFHCHGPDERRRKAKLRLDTRDGLFRTSDGVTVVVPGKPDGSELVKRILSDDEDEVMPPPDLTRRLTAEQKSLLRRWVQSGAP